MILLYIAPRYHTNQVPIMKGWHDRGDRVHFWAQFEGVSEVHDYVVFQKISKSFLGNIISEAIDKKNPSEVAEDRKITRFIPSMTWLITELKKVRPDIVIMRECTINTLLCYFACRICGIKKVILYTQSSCYRLSSKSYSKENIREIIKIILFPRVRFSPVLYKNSPTEFKMAPHTYYIPLVCETTRDRNHIYSAEKLRLLDIGKYRKYKNHFFLIDALKPLRERTDIALTVLGQAVTEGEYQYYDQLKAYITESGLDAMVTLRTNVSFRDINTVYDAHDVLVLPSTNETAGMVILEAMANGLAVISSEGCGLSCYVQESKCGYVFQLDSTEQLTDYIRVLADNKRRVIELGEIAKKAVDEKYSFANYYACLKVLLKKEFDYDC